MCDPADNHQSNWARNSEMDTGEGKTSFIKVNRILHTFEQNLVSGWMKG